MCNHIYVAHMYTHMYICMWIHTYMDRYDSGKEIPWDVRKAQPALVKAEEEGLIKGYVLDAGVCHARVHVTVSCSCWIVCIMRVCT